MFLPVQTFLSVNKYLSDDYKNKVLKYYTNKICVIYFIRYLLHCLKVIFITYLLLFSYFINIIDFKINLLDCFIVLLGLIPLFLPSLLFAIFTALYTKLYSILNIVRVLLFFIITSSESILIPLSYSIKLITDKFIYGIDYSYSILPLVLLNFVIYSFLGYIIASKVIWKFRYKLL